jgi:hypothetical protein
MRFKESGSASSIGALRLSTAPILVLTLALSIAIGCSARQTVVGTLTSKGVPALVFTSTTLPPYIAGSPYSVSLASMLQGGEPPYTFMVCSGSLPSGLTMNSDGTITGTVAVGTVGDFSFSAVVRDSDRATDAPGSGCPGSPASGNFTLTLSQAPRR